MRELTRRIIANPKYSKIFEWGKLISVTGSTQIFVQALGLIGGILIIRLVSTKEYALYTLANTMLSTILLLADGGISAGTLSIGGKVWKDSRQLGKVVSTGIDLRQKFAIGSLAVSLPILFYLLISHGSGWISGTLITLSLIPAFTAALSDNLLEVPLKLNQNIVSLQKNQLSVNAARFVLLIISLLILPYTFIAILSNGIPRIWGNIKLRKLVKPYADLSEKPDPEIRKEVLNRVKRTLPGTIYYCASSQITIWLISIYGNTESIAQVGALGRFVVALSFFSILFATLIVPRFARLPEHPKTLFYKFVQILGVLFGITFCILAVMYFFPKQVLFVLGKGYGNLSMELLLVSISGCIVMISGIVYSLSNSRGWIIPPVLHISVSIVAQLILIYFMDLSQLTNVLMFSIFNAGLTLLMFCGYFFYRVTIAMNKKE